MKQTRIKMPATAIVAPEEKPNHYTYVFLILVYFWLWHFNEVYFGYFVFTPVCVCFEMLDIWSRFVPNNAKISWIIIVNNIVRIPVFSITSQINVDEGLSENVMDHLTIVLMNTVLNITKQLECALMETGKQFCFGILVWCYRLVLPGLFRCC